MAQKALEILNSLYGYDSFRGHQADIIEHVAEGNNALVLMPTGGGKSLCYQIPSLLRDGVGDYYFPSNRPDAGSGGCHAAARGQGGVLKLQPVPQRTE